MGLSKLFFRYPFVCCLFLVSQFAVAQDAVSFAAVDKIAAELEQINVQAKQPAIPVPAPPPATAAGAAAKVDINAAAMQVAEANRSCVAAMKRANITCGETTNPTIGKFVAENGMVLQGVSTAGQSLAGQCSAIGDVLKAANVALTTFQAACGTMQTLCTSSCAKVEAAEKAYSLAIDKSSGVVTPESLANHKNALARLTKAKSESQLQCASYKVSMQQAMSGVMMTLVSMQTAQKCEDDTSNASLDCNSQTSVNYGSQNCQCARGELSPAQCQGIKINTQAAVPGQVKMGAANTEMGEGAVPNIGDGNDGVYAPEGLGESSAQASASPAYGGGGSGATASGGGASGAIDGSGITQRRLNPNILGGFGGGGGGGSSSSGPGYSEESSEAKSISRTVAAKMEEQELKKQITFDGRTNFEKVRTRYRDNLRTFLNK